MQPGQSIEPGLHLGRIERSGGVVRPATSGDDVFHDDDRGEPPPVDACCVGQRVLEREGET